MATGGTQDISDLKDTRERKLTEKGEELHQSKMADYVKKLQGIWKKLNLTILDIEKHSTVENLEVTKDTLKSEYMNYTSASEDYVEYLQRMNTEDAKNKVEAHFEIMKSHRMVVEVAIKQTSMKVQLLTSENKTTSQKSSSRRSSNGSSRRSSVITRKRAELESSETKLKFVEEEAKIKRQQAMLDEQQELSNAKVSRQKADLTSELEVLAQKKEIDSTKAELEVLEAEEQGRDSSDLNKYDIDQDVKAVEQTARYVQQVTNIQSAQEEETTFPNQNPQKSFRQTQQNLLSFHDNSSNIELQRNVNKMRENDTPHTLNVNAPAFNPTVNTVSVSNMPNSNNMSITSEFCRFLLKKDLLMTRLYKFNDQPEFYAMWKASFKSIINELCVSTDEELDLLITWLGPESVKHAMSIRSSLVHDPTQALIRIWERLEERYRCPELVEKTLKTKLMTFPNITNKDFSKLYELSDLLSEIESIKQDQRYTALLAYFDSSVGIVPIVNKLPYGIQERWTSHAVRYKKEHGVTFPPFSVFVEFIRDISRIKNDPCFMYGSGQQENRMSKPQTRVNATNKSYISTHKTDVTTDTNNNKPDKICPLHKSPSHTLNKCKSFKGKPISERRKFLKEHGICFKCCESNGHLKKNCTENVKCSYCDSELHASAMHIENYTPNRMTSYTLESSHGEETEVKAKCTQICSGKFTGKSCAKYVLVKVHMKDFPQRSVKAYAVLDDQSNTSLAKSDLFDKLGVRTESREYTLSSCAGTVVTSGRRLTGCVVQSLDGQTSLELPVLTECNYIPDSRDEIPTPEVAFHHEHLKDISDCIPKLDNNAPILLLIGRDLISAHHVLEHRIGLSNAPYAQRLNLGWVIIGETCLGKIHPQEHINVNKTYILRNNRPSIFTPCSSEFELKENGLKEDFVSSILNDENDSRTVFSRTENDNKPGLSIEDKQFLQIMEREFQKDSEGNWISPLPFRTTRQRLPNNRDLALKRAKSLHSSLLKDTVKSEHFVNFMQKILDNGHAEVAPSFGKTEECWYLPIFGVYHPRKPDKIRVVLDSSAKHEGICLNDVLLSGPDLTNNLLGILLRFRKEPVAITADIEQMFYCFKVCTEHRNFLRFLWYRNNDLKQDMIEYRMCVHVFGNKPSPAVATYGLIKTAILSTGMYGQDVSEFVENNFYVDDGLISLPSDSQAIDLLRRTKDALQEKGNLRLHKITSNSTEVMRAFQSEDLAKDVIDLSPEADIPLQRSLGISWNIQSDSFTYQLSTGDKPYTRRGLLSTINSLYDPIGFAAPVTLQGKLFLRNLLQGTIQWDDSLPVECQKDWEDWKKSLQLLSQVHIPRTYTSSSLKLSISRELHIFSDASEQAIAGVAYLKTIFKDKPPELSFILGKAKVAPLSGHTIPRLELCGAVLATELYQTISEQMNIEINKVRFYTDSKIVLGYIHNETRRFYTYVSNRVERIRRVSNPDQWSYIATELNPADYATRIAQVSQLQDSPWLKGPSHMLKQGS